MEGCTFEVKCNITNEQRLGIKNYQLKKEALAIRFITL